MNTTTDLDREVQLLERNLRDQLECHSRLRACLERNREALRRADMEQIRHTCGQENEIAQTLAELEKSRLALVGRLTRRLAPDADQPVPVARIVDAVGGDTGERLAALSTQLRGVVDEVRRASAVVRSAADALARHMTGVMQTVQSALGRARVYGRRGRLVTGDQSQFCVDVRS